VNDDVKNTTGRKVGIAVGVALGAVALYVAAKRYAARMETPDPSICEGFEVEGIHCVNLGVTTSYLLQGEDGVLVIDTGYARDYAKFRAELARAGVALDEITALLLTHGHDDHAGFAAQLREETGARLIVHRDALPLLRGEQMTGVGMSFLNARVFGLALMYALLSGRQFGYPPVTLREDDIVVDGDDDEVLRSLGFDAEIVATPGHTSGSISVMTPQGRTFCGDAAMNFLPITGAGLRPIFLSDQGAVFASWRKLLDRGATVIYPAHGAPFRAARLADGLRTFCA
jgi:glyoxylase-like metal-dependent hydrolase (beta-lactamase superfamily II)